MHIRRQLLLLIFIAGVLTAIPGYAVDEGLLAEYNYYESGKIELNAGNYPQAIEYYTNFQRLYPDSPYIPQAQLERAYAYYKLGDAEAAVGMLQGFLTEENNHPHKPYAFYLAGLSEYQETLRLLDSATSREAALRARGVAERAIDYFSQLVDKFPGSQYSEDARQKTTYLLEKMLLYRIKVDEEGISQSRQKRIQAESERSMMWLLKQPASHYTLQLARTPDYDTAFKLATQYKLEKSATIIETQTAADSGYTLLYGVYPSKREALEAGSSLPGAILQGQPWVRDMNSLQAEIIESRLIAGGMKRDNRSGTQAGESPPAANDGRTPHERWLLSQSPNALTVQLMATDSEESLLAFIEENKLADQAVYYRGRRKDGSSGYFLLMGVYPDRTAAIHAARQAAARLGIAQPWIRNFKGIQKEISGAN